MDLTGHVWLLSVGPWLVIATWLFIKYRFTTEKPPHVSLRVTAFVMTMLCFFLIFLGPIWLWRVLNNMPMDAKGPDWEIWLLILSGGIAAGVASLVHGTILRSSGYFSEDEIDKIWRGEE